MSAMKMSAIESVANDFIRERIELDDDRVTEAVVTTLGRNIEDGLNWSGAIEAGVIEAIDEFMAEIECQAKEIALRLLRERAEVAKREAALEV